MQKALPIDQWLLFHDIPILDVRSPSEFMHGHISTAHSLPLFSDEERAIVGTLYKQEGKEPAMQKALELVGPQMHTMVAKAKTLAPIKKARIHCWRGGMRSSSVAWLLYTMGYEEVYTLAGGYKAYRHWIRSAFEKSYDLFILGGKTGSAKTEILKELDKQSEPTIDLEKLAHHKGSAFGWIGEPHQPSQEQFENLLGESLHKTQEALWLEDESENIGSVRIPNNLFRQLRDAPVFFLDIPRGPRIQHLVKTYSQYGDEKLQRSILKIERRLGGLQTKNALVALQQKDYEQVADIALAYYDKTYENGATKRTGQIIRIPSETIDPMHNAALILHQKAKYLNGKN